MVSLIRSSRREEALTSSSDGGVGRVTPCAPPLEMLSPEDGARGATRPTCVCEAMMTTGESPSPGAACSARESEGYCVAARRGGELPEGKDPSQTIMSMKVNSIRPARWTSLRRKGEVGAARRPSSPHIPRYRGTGRGGRVVGVRRVRRHHGINKETRAGARRERCGSQSRHSSCEAGNDRGAKGGRKVKA